MDDLLDKQCAKDGCSVLPASLACTRWSWLAVPILLLAAIAALFYLDVSLARCVQQPLPSIFRQVLQVCEPFGNGVGVVLLVAFIWRVDRHRQWHDVVFLLAAALGAGLLADCVKVFIGRQRPRVFDFHGDALNSFQGWLPPVTIDDAHSFPSAHTATAVGFAFALATLYPSGRELFLVFALTVGLQRITSHAHFASDVLTGAAIGCATALCCTSWWRRRADLRSSRLCTET